MWLSIRNLHVAGILAGLLSVAAVQAALPVSTRADILATEIVDAVKHKKNTLALEKIAAYRALEAEGHKTPPPVLFMEARLAKTTGDNLRAYKAVEAYLSVADKSDRNYSEALRLYSRLNDDPDIKVGVLAGEMVSIPGGSFQMGSADGDDDEKPVHPVNIRPFRLGKYEVTQGQWRAVMGNNPADFSSCGDACPVEQVSWDDVQTFITKLNRMTGRHFRLPTEAEWEYACKGGLSSSQYCGGEPDSIAWYNANSGEQTHPVGQKQPNRFGLHDMSGNVWEWVQDCWHDSYTGAPADGSAWKSGDCSRRVSRGGSWGNAAADLRAASRVRDATDARLSSLGFRLAQDL